MQNVKFGSVNEFLDYLPSDELEIVEILRAIILETIPNCREKLSYNVPFYSRYRTLGFIWPGSVLWGKKKIYQGVRLGFTKGFLMEDPDNYLDKGERKQIYTKDFLKVEEIDPEIIRSFLFQAIVLDEEREKGKKK